MKFIGLAFLLPILIASCAVKPGNQPEPATPPAVTGAVSLTFEGVFGSGARMSPWGISAGVNGDLYVCDREARGVLRLDGTGAVVSRFGGFESRAGRMFSPVDVSASDGVDVFVLDGANSRIIRLDRALREPSTIFGMKADAENRFGVFAGIVLDRETGDLFITDGSNGAIIRLDRTGSTTRVLGGFGSNRGSLREPAGIDIDSDGTLIVADRRRGAVALLPRSGAEIRYIGEGSLESPCDVAALPKGRISVADRRGVLVLNRSGAAVARAGYGTDRKMAPRSVVYHDGRLFISDALTGFILVYRME